MTTPAYGHCTVDHEALRFDLEAFRHRTMNYDLGPDIAPDGAESGVLLYGTCKVCKSTLAVQISLARGHVLAGTIETPRNHCPLHEWCFQEPGHKGDCILPF